MDLNLHPFSITYVLCSAWHWWAANNLQVVNDNNEHYCYIILYLIVNIILDYLKGTVYNLFTITINIQESVLWKESSETFKENPWKRPLKMTTTGLQPTTT